MNRIHISIDDVKGIFKALSEENLNSIFETRTMYFLKQMNSKYGTCFDLYCTCQDKGYFFHNNSDKYLKEFEENKEWMRFGYHCYDEYELGDPLFEEHITCFVKDLEFVNGHNKMSNITRLHGFKGKKEECLFLKKYGIDTFLSSDEGYDSYYLNHEQNEYLRKNGEFFDEENGLLFIKSCTRLENVDSIFEEIEQVGKQRDGIISVFTHEWQIDREDVRNKLEACCKYAEKTGNA